MAKEHSKQSDAVQLLKADHKLVKKLFDQFRSASDNEKPRIAGQLFNELTIHATLEEEIFYPAVRNQLEPAGMFESSDEGEGLDVSATGEEETEDLEADEIDGATLQGDEDEDQNEEVIAQAYEEHQMAAELIEQLKTLDPTGSDYQELFTELEDAVLEHIAGEENIILPVAATQLDVQTLGIAMQRRRNDLSSSLAA
jgi:hemerythrin-like domain-containing protein